MENREKKVQEKKGEEKKENIQQKPDQADDQNKKPITPEPPQRKDPRTVPDADSKGKE